MRWNAILSERNDADHVHGGVTGLKTETDTAPKICERCLFRNIVSKDNKNTPSQLNAMNRLRKVDARQARLRRRT
jgi:hypothetical protein